MWKFGLFFIFTQICLIFGIMWATKNVALPVLPSDFLCNSFVEGETKETYCVLRRFLHTLFLKNEEKTSEQKYREIFSYQLVAHMPKLRQISAKNKKRPKIRHKAVMPPALQLSYRRVTPAMRHICSPAPVNVGLQDTKYRIAQHNI